ncbi:hypothetical protein [Shewanella algae]|uniref:hypothetical protein n=1 Tax=Shewanella algae TaxID=38313 RepID=UPI0031F4A41E
MISLTDTKLLDLGAIKETNSSLCFVGPVLDQRGSDLVNALKINNRVIEISFDVERYTFSVNSNEVSTISFIKHLNELVSEHEFNSLFIESTTLGFVELLLILKWFSRSTIKALEIIYAEPDEYRLRTNYMNDFGKHEFDLSTHSGGYKAIPGFAKVLTQSKKAILIASVGYERSRLGQLLTLDDGAYIQSVVPIYGTPGFKAGWDKHSFFQNIETLNDIGEKPQFVSANSPIDMLNMLRFISDSYSDQEITLAPLGTKPLSIASAIFLMNNPNTTLKYDHPNRKGSRSTGIGQIHQYTVVNES